MKKLLYDILASHQLWLETFGGFGKGADLEGANLKGANLKEANLKEANLNWANLNWANLVRANLDFSCLPLSCKGTNIKVDKRFFSQILYHLTRQNYSEAEEEVKEALNYIKAHPSINWFCNYRNDLQEF